MHRASNPKGIPAELRDRPRWVRHSAKKVPLQVDGRAASSTNPATWTSYPRVRSFERKGFVLNGDGVVCVDLDHCLVDGRPVAWAAELLAELPETYVEVSLSGTGLHVFGFGRVRIGRKIRDHRNVEVYGNGRYIAITGDQFGKTNRLADLSEFLVRFNL